ncbi:hypothetical protein JMJ77_0001742 [Colletotrichum scovillei]|uniref:Uncharacterized protein n=1 Tax=Colletotrichum scovillei TaxID=1209932 RepID=A0A9P7R6K0_9PEZI|nr:hypothetical protein JMJ77_0001742 [Colletotrichum scovillei]KAG7070151.1 hypothetical protein JMJ76_0001408 [Colletotrichum scovillei]KAG7078399.1 hypothetical protein JMJ78_0002071 [Colletotrichum scovillei]
MQVPLLHDPVLLISGSRQAEGPWTTPGAALRPIHFGLTHMIKCATDRNMALKS